MRRYWNKWTPEVSVFNIILTIFKSLQEDELLIHWVTYHKELGTKLIWEAVAQCLENRSESSCRHRWINHWSGFDTSEMTKDEEKLIVKY